MCYHGFIPSDMYMFPGQFFAQTGRLCKVLAADFVFKIPIFGYLASKGGAVPAGREAALQFLREGEVTLDCSTS